MLIRILVLCAVTAYYFARSKPINKITQFVKFCCSNFWLVCSYAFAPLGDGDDDEMDEFLAEDDEEDSDVEEFNMEKTKIRLGSGLILRQKNQHFNILVHYYMWKFLVYVYINVHICMKIYWHFLPNRKSLPMTLRTSFHIFRIHYIYSPNNLLYSTGIWRRIKILVKSVR